MLSIGMRLPDSRKWASRKRSYDIAADWMTYVHGGFVLVVVVMVVGVPSSLTNHGYGSNRDFDCALLAGSDRRSWQLNHSTTHLSTSTFTLALFHLPHYTYRTIQYADRS